MRELPLILGRAKYEPGRDVALCPGPLYHGANLGPGLKLPLSCGVGVALMDGFSAEGALALIARRRVTHAHMVPTMIQRMLALDAETRRSYDLSSLRFVLHGGAPFPVEAKLAALDWLGPVLYEYYGAVEGFGAFITPEEYRKKPGAVGQVEEPFVEVRDEAGRRLPPGEVGGIYILTNPGNRFVYHKDAAKTAGAFRGDYFSVGDLGYVDEDGYLFLVDRAADVVISGGVNIYPAEVDAALLSHPAVADAAAFGVPDPEWGESLHAAVELKPGLAPSPERAAELIRFCQGRLARYKCPRRIYFEERLPREETGKSCRRLLRERHRRLSPGASP
jgi:long-chain acyl-CoA synthetase